MIDSENDCYFCQSNNFLCILCLYCKHYFCENHYQTFQHNCKNNITILSYKNKNKNKIDCHSKCIVANCQSSCIFVIDCLKCNKSVCIRHRLNHKCYTDN